MNGATSIRSTDQVCCAVLALLFMTISAPASARVAVNATDIVCQLSVSARLPRGEPAVLTLSLHNRGRQVLQLLRRNTPLEGWLADSMIVELDGRAVPYTGPMAKRPPPSAAEYVRVKPGARIRYRASLQDAYDVALPGRYRVAWRGDVMDALSGSGKPDAEHMSPQVIDCPAVSFVRLP
jgi:hypothetical protein